MGEAQKYGLIESNPCLKSAWAVKSRNVGGSQDWLSEEEMAQLEPMLASYKDSDGYPIGLGFQLVIYAGVTLSEAVALRWKDVDLEDAKIRVDYFVAVKRWMPGQDIKRTCELEPLARRKKRVVPIPVCLVKRLEEVRESYHGEDEEFVLCKSSKEPVQIDRMRAVLKRWSVKCGMREVTPQMLRDTYAMRAVHTGAASDMIAELMGFASTRYVIRRYMPASAENKRELVNRMFEIK